MMNSMNKIKVMQSNLRGLKNKKLDLKALIADNEPDVICLNETFLKNDETLKINGYNTITLNRRTRGIGVMILIKDHIKTDEITKVHINRHEIIQCRPKLNKQNHVYITSIYVPPQAKIDNELIEILNKENTIIVGDINCKHTKWGCNSSNSNRNSLIKNLYNIGLKNINPTYYGGGGGGAVGFFIGVF